MAKTDFVFPTTFCVYTEQIEAHFSKIFGEPTDVCHEILSQYVHIDVHHVPSNDKHDHQVLFTTGMSDLPMCADDANLAHAELMMYVPREWEAKRYGWCVDVLRYLARYVHANKAWIGEGYAMPTGKLGDTGFTALFAIPPYLSLSAKERVIFVDKTQINFYILLPLYQAELEFKLKFGTQALLKLFIEHKVSYIVDPNRPNVAVNAGGAKWGAS